MFDNFEARRQMFNLLVPSELFRCELLSAELPFLLATPAFCPLPLPFWLSPCRRALLPLPVMPRGREPKVEFRRQIPERGKSRDLLVDAVIRVRPSRRCPFLGKLAMLRFCGIALGSLRNVSSDREPRQR